jgi:hypothetical protein
LVGGFDDSYADLASAELYDPKARTFVATGSMSVERSSGTATLLKNGQVLLAGGAADTRCELYNPKTARFLPTGSLGTERWEATATLLQDGRVLVAGGAAFDQDRTIDSAELYTP